MEKKTFYLCDPNKNIQCSKTCCKHNKNSMYQVCDMTSHIEYSVNGIPIKYEYPPVEKNAF